MADKPARPKPDHAVEIPSILATDEYRDAENAEKNGIVSSLAVASVAA